MDDESEDIIENKQLNPGFGMTLLQKSNPPPLNLVCERTFSSFVP